MDTLINKNSNYCSLMQTVRKEKVKEKKVYGEINVPYRRTGSKNAQKNTMQVCI